MLRHLMFGLSRERHPPYLVIPTVPDLQRRYGMEHQPLSFRGSFVRVWIAAWFSSLTLSPPSKEGEVVSLFGGQIVVGRQAALVFCRRPSGS